MPKKLPIIWATFARNFVAKNIQKSPNLVTLVVMNSSFQTFEILQSSDAADEEHNLADVAGFEILPHEQLLAQGRQTREPAHVQGRGRQTVRLWLGRKNRYLPTPM